ncbi:histidine phosphotransferase family protein [Roseobacter sp. N2S]|uniref:histidine phosphotransferase family protein n=1 Tax=Roseobacter sp. N2S TaxID=2663844 RepID=UPI00285B1A27|nr:histidine phosphotransferase family protein [Roseobacter sp. N2S]MDR6263917.1 histidine phosphotransferase ChpT [Roseobacter sp. N2S]
MYDNSPDITALISARICHDLASPLGAIANGVELLELSGMADTPESILLADSVTAATARMAFIRMAYGSAQMTTMVGASKAQKILAGNFSEKKIMVQWRVSQETPKPMIKLLFLLVQSVETALPYGGEVDITERNGKYDIHTNAKAVRHDPTLWACLSNDAMPVDMTSAQVHFELARQQATRLKRKIEVRASETTLDISVV